MDNNQLGPTDNITSPTLEALCYDLDMFINELTGDTPSHNNSDIAPLNLEVNVNGYRTSSDYNPDAQYEDESPGYSPVLENYTRFSEIAVKVVDNDATEDIEVNSLNKITPSATTLSPPMSPSFLRINRNNSLPVSNTSTGDDYVFTTRSSSINRTTSTSSGKSIVPLNHPSSPKIFSSPASPLVFEISTIPESDGGDFFSISLLSVLATQFIEEVINLNDRRRIFCTAEYPLSFNGEEAMEIIQSIIPGESKEKIQLDIIRGFMRADPPLIKPIAYSEKSISKNKFYNSPTEVYTLLEECLNEEALPHSVYTPLTPCYSISCLPGQPNCYSPLCPNKYVNQSPKSLERQHTISVSIASSTSHDTSTSRAWSASASKALLQSMSDDEIKRQEAIHELIYTEEDYVRDLRLLDEVFAQVLLTAQCIEEDRREEFCSKVFNNYLEILQIHTDLCDDLKAHQAQCASNNGMIDQMGHIFLRYVTRFMEPYLKYGPHVVLAEYEAKLEAERNILFQNFIKSQESKAECRRLAFRHFIILPVTRLQRYSLLLGAIHKKTPETNPDKENLNQCINIIKSVASKMDEGTVKTKNTLRVYEVNSRIRFKPGEPHDLELLQPGRYLYLEGDFTRKSHMVVETVELHLFLFDNYLLMTKQKKSPTNENDVEYVVSKRPIPLELLQVQEINESSSPFGASYPLLIQHLGRQGGDFLIYAENAAIRTKWKDQILEAKAAMDLANIDKYVFGIKLLSNTAFKISNTQNYGRVTCTVPFVGTTGIRMLAVGTQQGVWMGIEGDTNTISPVLTISEVNQIAVLEDHHILLVLSDKTLYAYALDSLLSKDSRAATAEKNHQKVVQHVSYFHAGICNNRTLVIAMKKSGVNSTFKVFEPVCGDLRDAKSSKFFTKSGLFGRMPSWFKSTLEFYIGTEAYSMHFLKARVVVVCSRGFEIINLDALHMNRNLPDPKNPDFAFVHQRPNIQPLGMFRCKENYLLCYDAFAFMVNIHGAFVANSPLIEWKGTPQSVAFYNPYVIGFDSRFIEVRHVQTGELIQVLAGENMRCLQFMQTALAPVIHGCMAQPGKPDYQSVFQLMGTFEPPI
ncbi:CNH domain-containing protein [Pilobolus umbonatus]|nr:CNH domain-containing protein [Pilobolus umbonatus]